MIEIINRQRAHKNNQSEWAHFAQRALQSIQQRPQSATVVFVSDATIRKLNRQFRGQSYATDVLSFAAEPEPFERENALHLGEIVVSTERAAVQAKQNGLTFKNEVQQLILHGLIHLCGYDHETDYGEMNRLELKLRKKLGI